MSDALAGITFRRPTEADYLPMVRVINDWWGGRNLDVLLPRLWLQHFTGTSWLAETGDGALAGFLVGFHSPDKPDVAYCHFIASNLNLRSRATIFSTGGFSANPDMVRRYIGAQADQCKLRGSPQCTGDGLRMGLEIGAKAVNLQYFYGHLIARKALTDDRFWPYPRLDSFVDEGILIDSRGRRFVDEGRGDVAVANDLARSADVTGATLVFDHATWSASRDKPSSTSRAIPAPNPWLWQNEAEIFCADTAAALADLLGIDQALFSATVTDYNRAVAALNTSSLAVIRTGNPRLLRAPFYGLRVVPGITFTMGGLAVNGRCEVLNVFAKSLPGFYAAGDAIGGLMGGYKGGYTGGLMQAVVTGLLAGETAAQHQ